MDRSRAGGRGRGQKREGVRGNSRRGRTDMGRSDWSRNTADKRARTEATQEANKRRRLDNEVEELPIYATKFSKEEIEADGKKPKKKVAVMLGYSGSGYKGMQLNHHEKTIEGDLFSAFVAAGAISKANADDPKKSSLVRCARTDRGVHAAGNVISLKMIIENPDIVKRINEKLSPQIRVWGIERTNGSFSAYQLCDSRIYEYLIPTYCFLPPHPQSFLGKELPKLAEEAEDLPGHEERQSEVAGFWEEIEAKHVKPFLDSLGPELSASIHKALYDNEPRSIDVPSDACPGDIADADKPEDNSATVESQPTADLQDSGTNGKQTATEPDHKPLNSPRAVGSSEDLLPPKLGLDLSGDIVTTSDMPKETDQLPRVDSSIGVAEGISMASEISKERSQEGSQEGPKEGPRETAERAPISDLEAAVKQLKHIIIAKKKAYRIDSKRLARVRSVLNRYVGTHNFHNYTISKLPRDPSAKRVIKSFTVAPSPIIINDTEWLSLKVHGQSFMMHQIRKMVTMAALIVRCGCPENIMNESYGHERLTIPKAPSLGLLLERPVFDTYNNKKRVEDVEGKGEVAFDKFEKEIEEFKQREIYERIFSEEAANDTFHSFFASLDSVRKPDMLYLSSLGIPAAKRQIAETEKVPGNVEQAVAGISDDEGEDANEQDG
ncbi:MAG: hypothetical protein Q9166_005742 [cf. Caloplaca sp. 2 TL-2023]